MNDAALVRNDSDGSLMYRTRLKYDKLGNLERFAENVGTETHETAYDYDRDNRVTALTYDGDTQKVSYGYDELGQLIRVNDPHENATWVYNYDRGGNITSKAKYAYAKNAPSRLFAQPSCGRACQQAGVQVCHLRGQAGFADVISIANG